jgi:hypothetical protein
VYVLFPPRDHDTVNSSIERQCSGVHDRCTARFLTIIAAHPVVGLKVAVFVLRQRVIEAQTLIIAEYITVLALPIVIVIAKR